MEFLYPSFLWALAAIAIPIIIHLFHFRRFKKVYFTNVRFLKEVKEETANRNRLKNLLVLLSRILAITALVFAFAQPFIPQDVAVKQGEKIVSIFIDNSFSMSSRSQELPLLEKAKQRAKEIVEAYQVEDRFQILTNDFEGRHQRLVSKEDALSLIDEVTITPAVKALSKVNARQKQLLNNSTVENKTIYLISDFQKNITDIKAEIDTTFEVNLIPLQSVQKTNISIDSAWFEAPVQMMNQANPLVIKVRNHSDEKAENIRLTLNHQGQIKPIGSLTIPPRSYAIDTVNVSVIKAGWHEAELEITDFPVQFDDKYFFTFNVPEQVNILVINESSSNRYLDAVFSSSSTFKITNLLSKNLDYSKFSSYQLIVTNDLRSISSGLGFELAQYVKNGGNLLVFPNKNAALDSYNNFLNGFPANNLGSFEQIPREVGQINIEEFIFKNVYENTRSNLKLPKTKGNFKISNFGSRGEETLLRYRDGGTFVGKYRIEQGHLFLSSAPLNDEFNDLSRNAEIFVPMIYKMSISTGKDRKIAFTIGKDEVIETDNKVSGAETVYKLKGRAEEFIPEQKTYGAKAILSTNNQVKEAGYYNLFLDEEQVLEKYAFNFDRKESDLRYLSEDELKTKVGQNINVISANAETDFTTLIGERSQGVILWKWCLIAALGFLLLEILLLRLWPTR